MAYSMETNFPEYPTDANAFIHKLKLIINQPSCFTLTVV